MSAATAELPIPISPSTIASGAAFCGALGGGDPAHKRGRDLVGGQRRLTGGVACSGADLVANELRVWVERGCDTCIHD
jgi:hypothetical protein